MDQDMVVLARVRLLGANRRVVRGTEGLWIRGEPHRAAETLAWLSAQFKDAAAGLLR